MSFLKNYRLVLVNQLQSLVKQWSQLVIKIQTAGPPSSGDSGWSVWVEPGNLHFQQIPCGPDAAGLVPTFWESLIWMLSPEDSADLSYLGYSLES